MGKLVRVFRWLRSKVSRADQNNLENERALIQGLFPGLVANRLVFISLSLIQVMNKQRS